MTSTQTSFPFGIPPGATEETIRETETAAGEGALHAREPSVSNAQPENEAHEQPVQLRFIMSPGHGWLEVPYDLCKKLGITGEISRYSYDGQQNGRRVLYLEEDADAGVFMRAAKDQGLDYEEETVHKGPNYCCRLPSYQA